MHISIIAAAIVLASAAAFAQAPKGAAGTPGVRVPVIYCTDLFNPPNDPDDHFDLASALAIPELDLKAIILDDGGRQARQPGAIPVSQMRAITGREVPFATGLLKKLKNPDDNGLDQPAEFQKGVELILKVLEEAREPVAIATLGSLRDVTAAFNRKPDLFRAKVGRLVIFIGDAANPSFVDYNVGLDHQAYIGLMRSGLPIYWVPCFDGGAYKNAGHASYYVVKQSAVLKEVSPEVLQYFIYALTKEKSDPLAFLKQPVDPAKRDSVFAGKRNLWGAAVLGALAGCTVAFDGTRPAFVPMKPGKDGMLTAPGALFGFSEVEITVSDKDIVQDAHGNDAKKVWRFEVCDPTRYAAGMTAMTAELLGNVGGKRNTSHAAP